MKQSRANKPVKTFTIEEPKMEELAGTAATTSTGTEASRKEATKQRQLGDEPYSENPYLALIEKRIGAIRKRPASKDTPVILNELTMVYTNMVQTAKAERAKESLAEQARQVEAQREAKQFETLLQVLIIVRSFKQMTAESVPLSPEDQAAVALLKDLSDVLLNFAGQRKSNQDQYEVAVKVLRTLGMKGSPLPKVSNKEIKTALASIWKLHPVHATAADLVEEVPVVAAVVEEKVEAVVPVEAKPKKEKAPKGKKKAEPAAVPAPVVVAEEKKEAEKPAETPVAPQPAVEPVPAVKEVVVPAPVVEKKEEAPVAAVVVVEKKVEPTPAPAPAPVAEKKEETPAVAETKPKTVETLPTAEEPKPKPKLKIQRRTASEIAAAAAAATTPTPTPTPVAVQPTTTATTTAAAPTEQSKVDQEGFQMARSKKSKRQ